MTLARQLKAIASELTILYVEDEKSLRENMATSLNRLFKNTLIAEDGQEAFELFKKNEIDIILKDINMPNVSGIELIKEVKLNSKETPNIIVLTAYNENSHLMELINLNVDAFMLKPVDKDNLIEVLYKQCSHIQYEKLLKDSDLERKETIVQLNKQNRILTTKLEQTAIEKNRVYKKRVNKGILKKNLPSNELINNDEIISTEDLEELNELSVEIDAYVSMLFKNERIDEKYLIKLSDAYKKYSSAVNPYVFFRDIASSLLQLSNDISTSMEFIKKHQEKTALLLEALHYTFENIRTYIPNNKLDPSFFNASIISDIETILNFLNETVADNETTFF